MARLSIDSDIHRCWHYLQCQYRYKECTELTSAIGLYYEYWHGNPLMFLAAMVQNYIKVSQAEVLKCIVKFYSNIVG